MAKRNAKINECPNELEHPLFAVPSNWKPPKVSDLPSWKGVKRLGGDCETRDDHLRELGPGVRRGGQLIGASFCIEDGPSMYLPLRHFGGDNVEDPEQALRYMRDNAKHFDGVLVGANIPYDLDYWAENGIHFPKAKWVRDVQVADPLLYELHFSYSLEAISERWGLPGKDEALLIEAARSYKCDPKAQMWKLPARYVGPYAETDARRPLEILRKQERKIEELGLQQVYDLESRLTPILVKMRRRGVRVDFDRLEKIERWTIAEEQKALDQIRAATGRVLVLGDVGKASALSPVLKGIGVHLKKTSKSDADQIDKEVLGSIDHPVARAILHGRKVNKLRTTFCASIRRYQTNGRIHATTSQLRGQKDFEADGGKGAKFGRCSMSDPNMQQQPSRDEFAKEWRSIYLPEEGQQWASVDYSQQEPRMAVHFAVACGASLLKSHQAHTSAVAMAERYKNDPTTDFHTAVMEMTGGAVNRKGAKTIGLGLTYGMGEAKMCADLGLPLSSATWDREREERCYVDADEARYYALVDSGNRYWPAAGKAGREIIRRFEEGVPYIRPLAKACEQRAKERGEIRTLSKRICHFPEKDFSKRRGAWDRFEWLHKALNRVIQGSSGDQTKQALVDLDEAGFFLQLQVHDEVTLSVKDRSEAQQAATIMENAWPGLHLPFKCDVEVGPSWGQAQ